MYLGVKPVPDGLVEGGLACQVVRGVDVLGHVEAFLFGHLVRTALEAKGACQLLLAEVVAGEKSFVVFQ